MSCSTASIVADALDLDRDPAVVLVAAHQVDRPDVGRPLAPHEPEALAAAAAARRPAAPAGRASTPSFSSAAASPMSCVTSESTSAIADVEPVLGRAGALAHDDAARRPPRSPSAASSSSAACSRRCRRGPSPTRRDLTMISRSASGSTARRGGRCSGPRSGRRSGAWAGTVARAPDGRGAHGWAPGGTRAAMRTVPPTRAGRG